MITHLPDATEEFPGALPEAVLSPPSRIEVQEVKVIVSLMGRSVVSHVIWRP